MVLSNDPAQQCRGLQALRAMEAWSMAPKVLSLLENRDPTLFRVQVEILLWFSELSKNDFNSVFDSKTQQQVRLALSRISDRDRNLEFPPQANDTTEIRNRREILHDLSGMASRLLRKWFTDSPEYSEPEGPPLFSELELQNDEPRFRRNPKRLYKGEVDVFLTYPDGSPHGVILQVPKALPGGTLPAGTHLYFTPEGRLAALRPNQTIRLLGIDFHYADSLFLDNQGNLASAVLEEDGDAGGYRCARNFPISFDAKGRPIRFKLAAKIQHEGKVFRPGEIVRWEEGKLIREESAFDPLFMAGIQGLAVIGGAYALINPVSHESGIPKPSIVLGAVLHLIYIGSRLYQQLDSRPPTPPTPQPPQTQLPRSTKSKLRVKNPKIRIDPSKLPSAADLESRQEAESEEENPPVLQRKRIE